MRKPIRNLLWRHFYFSGRTITVIGVIVFLLALGFLNYLAFEQSQNDVLNVAYSYQDGGGYCSLSDTGVSNAIRHDGSLILSQSKGGCYCCGFTFQVAFKVAEQRGLLSKASVYNVRKFQAEWYGTAPGSAARQCAAAVSDLRIGKEINYPDAEPGDFVAFYRTNKSGHSVIFLNWMVNAAGKIIGIHYRSSQQNTAGIGDSTEFFSDGDALGPVDRKTLHIARIDTNTWGRLLHTFS